MTDTDYKTRISDIAREVFRHPAVTFDDNLVFRDIPGFDSVLAIEYVLTIENTFGVTLNEEEVDNMHTMGDLLRLLQQKKAAG